MLTSVSSESLQKKKKKYFKELSAEGFAQHAGFKMFQSVLTFSSIVREC